MTTQFLNDVHDGLSKPFKTLPSKYFYDARGDALFVDIMASPEYYLTRAEMEIFSTQTEALIESLSFGKDTFFELIEFGAGDGSKTLKLLTTLLLKGYLFEYLPIDISQAALDGLKTMLGTQLPTLNVATRQGDYLHTLDELKGDVHPKVVLFLGSNIGNLSDTEAAKFIYSIGADLSVGDKLLLGADRIKPASIVLPAYSDREGVTRAFNLNLLHRINRELGGDFDLSQFAHVAEYNESEGVARSFLVSNADQEVTIKANNHRYHFTKGEKMLTEISRKYSVEVLQKILLNTDFVIKHEFSDQKGYFSDFVLERV